MSLIGHSRMNGPSLPFLTDIPFCICVCLVAKWCPTLYNPMDYRTPGSSVHGISQPVILEWVAISSSRGPSRLRNWTCVSCIAGGFFTCRASCCILLMLHFIMLFTLMCIRVGIKRIECSTGGGCEFKESPNNSDLSKKLFKTVSVVLVHYPRWNPWCATKTSNKLYFTGWWKPNEILWIIN